MKQDDQSHADSQHRCRINQSRRPLRHRNQIQQIVQRFQANPGNAKREQQKPGDRPPGSGAEQRSDELLQSLQIKLAGLIDPRQRNAGPAIKAGQAISRRRFAPPDRAIATHRGPGHPAGR